MINNRQLYNVLKRHFTLIKVMAYWMLVERVFFLGFKHLFVVFKRVFSRYYSFIVCLPGICFAFKCALRIQNSLLVKRIRQKIVCWSGFIFIVWQLCVCHYQLPKLAVLNPVEAEIFIIIINSIFHSNMISADAILKFSIIKCVNAEYTTTIYRYGSSNINWFARAIRDTSWSRSYSRLTSW